MTVRSHDTRTVIETSTNRVPYWARSTNPIVRRHLGLNWRTFAPEITPFLRGIGLWGLIFLIGAFIPAVETTTAILFISSIVILPVVGFLYLHILGSIAVTTADAMQAELRNNTLSLLRTTPMSLEQIFLGKIAVSMWKRMEDLVLVAQAVLFFIPPVMLTIYANYWTLPEYPVMGRAMIVIGLIVFLLRILIEPMLIGTLAVVIGVVVPNRNTAITTTLAITTFYFVVSFMFSRLPFIRGEILPDHTVIPPNLNWVFAVDFILPIVVPLLLSWGLLRLARRIVTAD